jgi:hypothetical protein
LESADLLFHSQNQSGYWFRWKDEWGSGFVVLKEYTDGSMRGNIYMDDGTNPGKLMGEFNGSRNKASLIHNFIFSYSSEFHHTEKCPQIVFPRRRKKLLN